MVNPQQRLWRELVAALIAGGAGALLFVAWPSTAAPTRDQVIYEGHLEENGAPLDGDVDLRLSLHGTAAGSDARLWTGPWQTTAVDAGHFAIGFGDDALLTALRDAGQDDLYLEVEVKTAGHDAYALSPRQRLPTAPSAVAMTSPTPELTVPSVRATGTVEIAEGLETTSLTASGGATFGGAVSVAGDLGASGTVAVGGKLDVTGTLPLSVVGDGSLFTTAGRGTVQLVAANGRTLCGVVRNHCYDTPACNSAQMNADNAKCKCTIAIADGVWTLTSAGGAAAEYACEARCLTW